MKALKEKRISLRSLWRRGLVILSLFALVFASCADSDNDTPEATGPARSTVYSIEIVRSPLDAAEAALDKNPEYEALKPYLSYEAQEVNLKGLQVLVRYESGPTASKVFEPGTEGAKFSTYPPYAVGVLGDVSTTPATTLWVPQTKYDLIMDIGGDLFVQPLDIPTVIPILREPTWAKVDYPSGTGLYQMTAGNDTEDNLSLSRGLNFIGDFGKKKYVDDYADFANNPDYKLQAEYADGEKKWISLKADTEWMIRPSYKNGKEAVGPGDLFVTVGRNPLKYDDPRVISALDSYSSRIAFSTPIATSRIDPALMAKHPYEAVFHVKSLELANEVKLDDFIYFDDDEPDGDGVSPWIQRLIDAGARLKVTYYTDGSAPDTKEFSVEDAVRMNKVWENYLGWYEEGYYKAFGVKGIRATQGREDGTVNTRVKTGIKLNYRGATCDIEVPVFTRLNTLEVVIGADMDGDGNVLVDMRRPDNDKGAWTATKFSEKIEVYAVFLATGIYADRPPAKRLVRFDTTLDATGQEPDSTEGVPGDEKLYSMNFGYHSTIDGPQAADWNTDGWGVCDTDSNNNRARPVIVYYAAPENETWNVGATIKNYRVPVYWTNIHVR